MPGIKAERFAVAIISADNGCALPEVRVHRVRGVKVKIVTAGRRGIQVAVRSKPEEAGGRR